MSNVVTQENQIVVYFSFDEEKRKRLREMFPSLSKEEISQFEYVAQHRGLDPFLQQIHPVKRNVKQKDGTYKSVMTPQTSIEGYRLIAERTNRYAPGPLSTFTYDKDGVLVSATSYVKKLTNDGTWHEVPAEAFFDEFCQKDKQGNLTTFWKNMKRNQLAKCAEALALRKAFPGIYSGIYTNDEMDQADNIPVAVEKIDSISIPQKELIQFLIDKDASKDDLLDKIFKTINCNSIEEIPSNRFDALVGYIKQRQDKQKIQIEQIQEAV